MFRNFRFDLFVLGAFLAFYVYALMNIWNSQWEALLWNIGWMFVLLVAVSYWGYWLPNGVRRRKIVIVIKDGLSGFDINVRSYPMVHNNERLSAATYLGMKTIKFVQRETRKMKAEAEKRADDPLSRYQ